MGSGKPAAGRATFLTGFSYFASTPVFGRAQIDASGWPGTGSPVQFDTAFACDPNYASPFFHANLCLHSSLEQSVGSYITRCLDPAASGTHYVYAAATGFSLADSISFDAEKVILFIGDSTWNGAGADQRAPLHPVAHQSPLSRCGGGLPLHPQGL